ncbi:hypothetical protein RYX36_000899 [Vicia faba]
MSRPPIMICNLKPEQNVWKITICVVNVWNFKERNDQQRLEAIIQDAKAEQIHVVTCSCDLDVWKNNLQENQTYMVYNSEIMLYDMSMKVCDNKYKLFFNHSITITIVDIPDIPQHNFYFKSFTDFQNGDFIVDHLYDVIGAVQQVVRTQVSGAGKKACVNLTLSDECGAEMDVTLWEAYVNQFINYAAKNGHVFLILTHAWCFQSSGNLLQYGWKDGEACLTITNKDESPKGKVVLCLEGNNAVNTHTNVTYSKTTTPAAQNWSPEASISNTPSKRLSPDSVQDLEGPDLLSPKLSTTKSVKTKSGSNTKNK